MEEKSEFEKGFTWRVIISMLVAAVMLVPASIYATLAGGVGLATSAAYLIVVLINEIARISRNPLKKQEVIILIESCFIVTAIAMAPPGSSGLFGAGLIYRLFYKSSPLTEEYKIGESSISSLIPDWMAPPLSSPAYFLRNLFHPDLLVPLLIALIMSVLFWLQELALTIIFSYLFIEKLELKFPFATIDASLTVTLVERESSKLALFITALIPGAVYSTILYVMPLLSGGVVSFLPLPWLDLTQYTGIYLPGALIGLGTDLSYWILGFLIPFNMATCMLIGSVAVWIIGNTIFLTMFPTVFPLWTTEYFTGMSLAAQWERSQFRVWLPLQVGFAIGLAIIITAKVAKRLLSAFKSTRARIEENSISRRASLKRWGYLSFPLLITMYLTGTLGSVALFQYLVPDFPIFLSVIVSTGFGLLFALVATATTAEMGFQINIPYLWQAFVYSSPYNGFPGWVFSPVIGGSHAPLLVNLIKAGRLIETRPLDMIKGIIVGLIFATILGLLSISFFWIIAPIPSTLYPYTILSWPINAMGESLMATREIKISPTNIMIGAVSIGSICILGEAIASFTHTPFSSVALVWGMATIPPYTTPTFVGSALGRFLFSRIFGRERWDERKGIIVAGLFLGSGISIGLGIAIVFLVRSSWVMPW